MSSTSADHRALRRAGLIRAVALVLVGLAIAFTATLHESFAFDHWLLSTSLTVIGAVTLVEYWALRSTLESWWVAARAVIAFAAAGALIAVADDVSLALVIVFWAMLTAVITLMRLLRGVQPRRVAVPSALLSLALAVVTLLVREDPVAVIGFFGAYAVIRGVFLGISAFDGGSVGAAPDADTSAPRTESAI
ncbi:hypothetical protein [Leucobacter soli]|uniref:hypothetical protein n=1 Tax=Leucobacter soli TaxID=2812850 RepID=UPI0036D3632D